MAFCPSCGKQAETADRFCAACGGQMMGVAEPAKPPNPAEDIATIKRLVGLMIAGPLLGYLFLVMLKGC